MNRKEEKNTVKIGGFFLVIRSLDGNGEWGRTVSNGVDVE